MFNCHDFSKIETLLWRSFQTLPLNEILNYDGEHLCKSPPRRLEMYMVATEPRDKYMVDLELNVNMSLPTSGHIQSVPRMIRLFPQSTEDVIETSYGIHLLTSSRTPKIFMPFTY